MVDFAATASVIWLNGELVPEREAKLHILSCAVKYGATVFEGICAYRNPATGELNLFRLKEHLDRLQDSMRIMRFEHDFSNEKLTDVVLQVQRRNNLKVDNHIRLSAYLLSEGYMDGTKPVGLGCLAVHRHEKTLEQKAVRAQVSSWRRIDDTTMPPRLKCAANYHNGRLAQLQAKADGYDEAILLTAQGKVCESPGACIFIVRKGRVATPTITGGILESVTRATMIDLFERHMRMPVEQRDVDRTELYAAEEMFLCGSGYEVTPVVGVDGLAVGGGKVGPVARKMWESYEALVRGQLVLDPAWLTPVWGIAGARAAE
jgi:branched-chain amino acid aminotransferase